VSTIAILKKLYKQRYRNSYLNLLNTKKLFNKRKNLYNKIYKNKTQYPIRIKEKLDWTSKYFFFLLTKKINERDRDKIFLYYKKYSVFLNLKKKYNKKLIKETNKKMNLQGYIYFSNLISKINRINKIQKLNCILKINDYILININKIKSNLDKELYLKSLQNEKKLIDFYLK
jgi:hypothetical protein